MKVIVNFRDDDARVLEYYLRKLYKTRARLPKLAKMAIRRAAAEQAKEELEKGGMALD